MAPEYVFGGHFSEKSDVYSYGVLLLEIINGRRNTSFYNNEHFFNLLGYVSLHLYIITDRSNFLKVQNDGVLVFFIFAGMEVVD